MSPLVLPGDIDPDDDEPVWYCPHGYEVPTSGGACHLCATEDADDSDYGRNR